MTADLTYGGYLKLDQILSAQAPRSSSPDEMLFIVVHQASELWIKLCLVELDGARGAIAADRLRPAFKHLARVAAVQAQLIQSWDVLGTLTPADYLAFRPTLGSSSGFQSHQYRLLEFLLGNRNRAHLDAHAGEPEVHAKLEAELARPSLPEVVGDLLRRRGFQAGDGAGLEAAWTAIYRDTERYWDLYELGEKLVDLETRVKLWRFAHLQAVERIIGRRMGTGGTTGTGYLEQVLKEGFFPELMAIRTSL
ncbi:MAG: tryptophan 2,3-dioxygenase [Caulobacteraceae bacterium]|nr:tryptophan 2,3-dioxygenase [Caulobacteraceae bacterium]